MNLKRSLDWRVKSNSNFGEIEFSYGFWVGGWLSGRVGVWLSGWVVVCVHIMYVCVCVFVVYYATITLLYSVVPAWFSCLRYPICTWYPSYCVSFVNCFVLSGKRRKYRRNRLENNRFRHRTKGGAVSKKMQFITELVESFKFQVQSV